ncbi:hypothetical protein F5880DRAFT_1618367, partial [Lentinula raphanica]
TYRTTSRSSYSYGWEASSDPPPAQSSSSSPLKNTPASPHLDSVSQPSDGVAATTRTTTRTTSQSAAKQKRGNPGKFQGEHLEFLQARIKGYLSLNSRHEKSKWIADLTHQWFEKYPWHTRSEPAEFSVLHDDPNHTLTIEKRAELEAHRDELLSQTVQCRQKELANWIHRQSQGTVQQESRKAFAAISNEMSKGAKGAP